MTRRAALFTEADLKRAIKVVREADVPPGWTVEVRPDGTLAVTVGDGTKATVDQWQDIRL